MSAAQTRRATLAGAAAVAAAALPLPALAAPADRIPTLFRRITDLQGRADGLAPRCRELHAALVATHGEPDESRFWAWDDARLTAYRALMAERARLDAAAAEARGDLLIAAPTTASSAISAASGGGVVWESVALLMVVSMGWVRAGSDVAASIPARYCWR